MPGAPVPKRNIKTTDLIDVLIQNETSLPLEIKQLVLKQLADAPGRTDFGFGRHGDGTVDGKSPELSTSRIGPSPDRPYVTISKVVAQIPATDMASPGASAGRGAGRAFTGGSSLWHHLRELTVSLSSSFLIFLFPSLAFFKLILRKLELSDDGEDAPEKEALQSEAQKAPITEAVWHVGISSKAIAVSEEVNLRAIELTTGGKSPSAADIVLAVLKAISTPSDQGEPRRPRVAMALSTRMVSDAVIQQAAKELKDLVDIRFETQEALEDELPELLAKRKAEVEQVRKTVPQAPAAPAKAPEMAPTPNRACFVCKEEIKGKTKQCSACKAIIYCSAECATKDWPQHKIMCPTYKKNMIRLTSEKLHDLPFTFYNTKKQLENFNQVAFLVQNEIHNIGVYRRLCQCYQQLAWGEISGELAAQQGTLETAEEKFKLLGLPESMFPLGKPFDASVDIESIDSWETWYKANQLPLSSPVALVFEVPLTIWFLIKEYAPKRIENGIKLTVHLLGPEREADLVQLYEALLPLLPSTDMVLHLIGPSLSTRLHEEHKKYYFSNGDSTLWVTLNAAEYGAPHYDSSAFGNDPAIRGSATPDLVIALNAAVFQYQSWLPTVKLLVDKGQRTVFTEPIETTVEILARNLAPIQASLAFPTRVNPFRQPVFQWKREVNLPGWSNGFITGMGSFK
ncbi:hypothetical protein HDU96_008520 [Phlyctochytrium bullatum]|nr:hypothetical protein HDU96_008520 [Phlyctochytrium bullatum]